MLRTLSLVLPALIPSWRFFKSIQPSPRVQWAIADGGDAPMDWHEVCPRPQSLSAGQVVRRLVWNPDWNESLFLVSCAERLQDRITDHSLEEIRRQVRREVARTIGISGEHIRFRIVFVRRDGDTIIEEDVFLSNPFPLADIA
jgi:uncharacterized protein (UPF0248 family)